MKLIDNIKNTFNLFRNRDPTENYFPSKEEDAYGVSTFGSSVPSYRIPPSITNEKSIIGSIYNQIATDVSNCRIAHVDTDENGRYVSDRDSALNKRLRISANLDQTGKAFIRDLVISMFDEGYVACVPIETDRDPFDSDSERFDILSIRTAKVTQWYPYSVKANVYNEYTGQREEVFLPKTRVAIIENPLYSVMNEPNGTLKRLKHKLALLDAVDDQNSSAKLNLIVQLPYVVRGQTKKHQAEERRKDLENQLANSKYGVAYTDGTEKITQINRPLDSNLQGQIEYLTKMLYAQLGLTEEVFNGTASESAMLNYYNRTVEPVLQAICDEFRRKFLSTTAVSQGQDIMYFKDPFKLVPVAQLATVGDTFIRNEILTANEFRSILGYKPDDNPKSDELYNPNIAGNENQNGSYDQESYDEYDQNEETDMQDVDELDSELDELQSLLNDEGEEEVESEEVAQNDENSDFLKHYASPYYDPVKAHEYYMRTRELKGRTSTAGLNDSGKEAAKYVKDKLYAERDQKIKTHKDQTDTKVSSNNDKKKQIIQQKKEETSSKISSLRERLKGMSKQQKAMAKESIQREIDSLREENAQTRQKIQETYSSANSSLRDTHKTKKAEIKEEYTNKYAAELDKMKNDSSMKKVSKKKG